MIRNIVFDMGQVLIRFDPPFFMRRLGLDEADCELLDRELFHSLEWSSMDWGLLDDTEAAASIQKRVPARLQDAVSALAAMRDRPILPIDGMEELIAELKGKGYLLYLLSNASLRQHDYWPCVPASRYFDGTLISSDVKLVKPMPEIYCLLCEKFSLKASECVFVDDSTLNTVGAIQAGMQAIVFHGDAALLRADLRALGVDVQA